MVGRGEASAPLCFRSLMSKQNWSFTKHNSCVERLCEWMFMCVWVDVHVCARTCVYVSTHTLTHVYIWRSFHRCCPSCVLRQRLLSWNLPCRQGYVASKPQGSTCLNSPSAGIKKINHYFWLFCVGPVEQPHIWKPCTCQWVSSLEHSLILKDDIINLCNISKNNYKKKTQKLLST